MNRHSANPRTYIFDDSETLAHAAASAFALAAKDAIDKRGKFLVALSGGSTPQAMFSLLAQPPYGTEINWTALHVFWGDERLVPPEDSGSNYYHAHKLLLSQVPVPTNQINRMRGELSPTEAVEDYAQRLQASARRDRSWPRFDLALMGLGSDGHTASLFPGSPVVSEKSEPVQYVKANYAGRPAQRLTLTPPVFNDAHWVLFLVSGKDKAAALNAVLHGPQDFLRWPAQSIQPVSQNLTWYVDAQVAKELNTL